MDIDKVIDVLETNLKVGTGNLTMEHKPPAYQIAEATRQALTELKKMRLGDVSVSDCIQNNEFEHYMNIDSIGYCQKCGSMKKYER